MIGSATLHGDLVPSSSERRSAPWRAVVLATAAGIALLGAFTSATLFLVLAGAGLLALILARPGVGTTLFLIVVYANLPVVAVRFHGMPRVVASCVVLLLVWPFLNYTLRRRQPVVLTPALPLLLVYLAALLLATATSRNVATSLTALGTFVTEGLVLVFLLTNAIRSVDAVRRAMWVLLLVGGLLGGLTVFQEVTKSYDNNFGGLQTEGGGTLKVDKGGREKVEIRRSGGPIGEQNRYAQILLVLVPFALYRVRHERSAALRLLATVAGVLCLGGVLLTFVRASVLAAVAIILVMLVMREVRLRHVAVFLVVLTAATLAIAPDYVARVGTLQEVEGLASDQGPRPGQSILSRFASNVAAYNTFVDHPLTGVGPDVFVEDYSEKYRADQSFEGSKRAHNMYLELLADSGIIGLFGFLAVVGVTMAQLLRLRRRWRLPRPDLAGLATALFLSLVGFLVSATFLQLSYQRYFWLLVGLANAVIWVLRHEVNPGGDVSGSSSLSFRADVNAGGI